MINFRYDYILYYLNKLLLPDISKLIISYIYPMNKNKSLLDFNLPIRYYNPLVYNNYFYEKDTTIVVSICNNSTIQRCINCGHIMIAFIEKNNKLKKLNFDLKYKCNCSLIYK